MRPRVFKVNISCSEWNETIAIKSGFANLNMFNEEILVRFPQFAGKQFKIYYNGTYEKHFQMLIVVKQTKYIIP